MIFAFLTILTGFAMLAYADALSDSSDVTAFPVWFFILKWGGIAVLAAGAALVIRG